MGELLELVAVAGGVAGGLGWPGSLVGVFHISQWIALQSCGERV